MGKPKGSNDPVSLSIVVTALHVTPIVKNVLAMQLAILQTHGKWRQNLLPPGIKKKL